METPLNASARPAGALLSASTFEIPPFQREYSWENDEISDFWNDLRNALGDQWYFLGLIILTDSKGRKQVVDGQQRLLTLTLFAAALYHEAVKHGRKALAEKIQSDFLRSIDYATDETRPRVILSDNADNVTFQMILDAGSVQAVGEVDLDSISQKLGSAFKFLRDKLREDLAVDPFKKLGLWTDFITNNLYFAVFLHPDTSSAYRVFEVINTRGRELTTADLLKNFVLSQTRPDERDGRYRQWQAISRQFSVNGGASSFVQYIRHVVTVQSGHILPKDLFDFLAQRRHHGDRVAPTPDQLMDLLEGNLPLYMQMIDPTLAGPAEPEALRIFSALNSLGVISVRPILLAMAGLPNSLEGMRYVLRLVVRRIVVANLGTGNVERRFGEAAKHVRESGNWGVIEDDLRDLNPLKQEFVDQLAKRSYNKGVLAFVRKSVLANTDTPDTGGVLHFIMPRTTPPWIEFSDEDASFWGSTIGNTFLSGLDRRVVGSNDWLGFKENMLPTGILGEWIKQLNEIEEWNVVSLEHLGRQLAEVAGNVWY